VVDGERPSKYGLDITFSCGNLNPFADQYSICFNNILKAPQRKKIQLNLIVIKEKLS